MVLMWEALIADVTVMTEPAASPGPPSQAPLLQLIIHACRIDTETDWIRNSTP